MVLYGNEFPHVVQYDSGPLNTPPATDRVNMLMVYQFSGCFCALILSIGADLRVVGCSAARAQ